MTVGAAAVSGFLDALQRTGSWDLERRLLVRPFSQPIQGAEPNHEQWAALRAEMARVSGTIVFIGGVNSQDGNLIDAQGVFAERDAADEGGAFLLAVGASGGVAATIARQLSRSSLPFRGIEARRPSDAELRSLIDVIDPDELAQLVLQILKRTSSIKR